MRDRDVFGVVVRSGGLVCLFWAALDGLGGLLTAIGLEVYAGIPVVTWLGALAVKLVFAVVGLFWANCVVRIAYGPDRATSQG